MWKFSAHDKKLLVSDRRKGRSLLTQPILEICWLTTWEFHRMGIISQFPMFHYLPVFQNPQGTGGLGNITFIFDRCYRLTAASCGDTCQIWMWYKESNGTCIWSKISLVAYYCTTSTKMFFQLRRQARQRREYIYRKSIEDRDRTIQEKKEKIKRALDGNLYETYEINVFHGLNIHRAGIILCMHADNERRRYIVTSSPIGGAHAQNDPCWENRCLAWSNISNVVFNLF